MFRYLFYLLPFVYLQIAPAAVMIAVLATFIIKSRQNELVTWAAAGQSVYRLLAPCVTIAVCLGALNYVLQELVVPSANKTQDQVRSQIRNKGVPPDSAKRVWVSNGDRIYVYTPAGDTTTSAGPDSETENDSIADRGIASAFDNNPASDNEMATATLQSRAVDPRSWRGISAPATGSSAAVASGRIHQDVWSHDETAVKPYRSGTRLILATLMPAMVSASDNEMPPSHRTRQAKDVRVFELANNGADLQTAYHSETGTWTDGRVILTGTVERHLVRGGKLERTLTSSVELAERTDPFLEAPEKSTHQNSRELRQRLAAADSEADQRLVGIALEKKTIVLFLPLVMILLAAPFAVSVGRRSNNLAIAVAVALWLAFTGSSNVLEQFGLNGTLDPTTAIWSPLVIFTLLGVYMLSRVRT